MKKKQNKAHDKKYCNAKTRAGTKCKRPSGWGTNHVGEGRCKLHGGKSTGAPPAKMKKNTNANKHGLFAKYLPQETMEIMADINTMKPIDILWMNIQMQFASIIRAQQIMFVKDREDRTEVLKKLKVENVETKQGMTQIPFEKEYELQHAWDKQATFMNSLSRSMGELRNMLKQFVEMADYDDVRLLEIKKMQKTIDKTEKETEFIEERTKLLKGEKKDTSLLDVLLETVKDDE